MQHQYQTHRKKEVVELVVVVVVVHISISQQQVTSSYTEEPQGLFLDQANNSFSSDLHYIP